MGARLPGIADRSCTGVPQGSSRIDNLCMWSISIPAIRCPWDYSLPAQSMLAPCIIKVHCLLRAFKKSRSAAKYMYLCAYTHMYFTDPSCFITIDGAGRMMVAH